jgi:hypothetical protein
MNYKLSKLYDADGNLEGRWFVYYFFRIPETGKWKRFKTYLGERYITRSERYNRAKELRKYIDQKLLRGFNPFASKNR